MRLWDFLIKIGFKSEYEGYWADHASNTVKYKRGNVLIKLHPPTVELTVTDKLTNHILKSKLFCLDDNDFNDVFIGYCVNNSIFDLNDIEELTKF